ncbi:MAG: diadenylate cyclase [Puniceicoccales bacterium]|jgi:DNA integrity scanning protein DisA with diadenylate cyclase activity/mannitol/fructose-specific phosphotransferase system IIA component (Ntr-type)|nr:diadenylate cyclase [Puniceicoccales bacterium]
MRIDRYLLPSRIVDLRSRDFQSALLELLALCPGVDKGALTDRHLLEQLLQRERTIPTHLDNSVALPHVRVPIRQKYIFAVGRCPEGLSESPDSEDRRVRILFLVLASSREKSYHAVLTTLARALGEQSVVERLERAGSLREFRSEILSVFKGVASQTSSHATRFNRLMLRTAQGIAAGADCTSIFLFVDTFSSCVKIGRFPVAGINTVVVTQRGYEIPADAGDEPDTIVVRAFTGHRLSQLRSSLLVGLMRGLIKPAERVCCVGGRAGSDKLDTILVVDVANEFPSILSNHVSDLLPSGVNAEVLERALGIATELAVEGREGKPIGCILVIGDRRQINAHTKPLILNPFYGYNEEDRNILSPFMDETVKELSSIDGAFIINGDGVIESAGTMLTAHEQTPIRPLPGGLGTRHVAACAISVAADCIAIAVSSSTGQVTLFRKGEPIALLDRAVNRVL